jgi:hypothetical protein
LSISVVNSLGSIEKGWSPTGKAAAAGTVEPVLVCAAVPPEEPPPQAQTPVPIKRAARVATVVFVRISTSLGRLP